MLLYNNSNFLRLLATRMGSIMFRLDMMICTLLQMVATMAMQALFDFAPDWAPQLPSHYGMLAIGGLVSFAVVFRTTLAWQRYWEAITNLHSMYQKWSDAYSQVVAYTQVSIEVHSTSKEPESDTKVERLENFLERIQHNFSLMSALVVDRLAHGHIEQAAHKKWRQQVILSGELDGGALGLPTFEDHLDNLQRSVTNHWSRRTYLVHKMPSQQHLQMLRSASSPIDVVQYWLIVGLSQASLDMAIGAPILSRMFQQLSDGAHGYEQALKMADVPFPLPFAQVLLMLLLVFAVFIPVYISAFTQSWVAGPVMAGLVFQGFWGFNELSKELENPYSDDVNDIVLADFHTRFVRTCDDIQEAYASRNMTSSFGGPDLGSTNSEGSTQLGSL